MSEKSGSMNLDARLRAEEQLYASMLDRSTGDRKTFAISLVLAVLAHFVVFAINFPEAKTVLPQRDKKVIVVKKYVPPPPEIERKQIIQQEFTRKVPVPDPTPDEPEPIREPEPEIEPPPIPVDAEVILGVPEPPPPSGPLIAGTGNVTNPSLIQATKVQPEYPELARQARLTGNVIMQAVVTKDGTVEDVTILRCGRKGVGFEEAAIAAVKQWRYKPATQNGRPVDVYFTINVQFTLH